MSHLNGFWTSWTEAMCCFNLKYQKNRDHMAFFPPMNWWICFQLLITLIFIPSNTEILQSFLLFCLILMTILTLQLMLFKTWFPVKLSNVTNAKQGRCEEKCVTFSLHLPTHQELADFQSRLEGDWHIFLFLLFSVAANLFYATSS